MAKNNNADKKVEPVVKAKQVEKTKAQKFKDSFITGCLDTAVTYILGEVLIPAVKDLVSDMVTGGLDMMLYGERRSRPRSGYTNSTISGSRISYSSCYSGIGGRKETDIPRKVASMANVVYETRKDAEDAYESLLGILEEYHSCSVADLYDISSITPTSSDYDYGWRDLRGVRSMRNSDGTYYLDLPRPILLKD